MAIMHPADIESYNYTGSEKKLYNELQRQLPSHFHVFYSIRWFDKIENKRVDSECDFMIFDPNFGFITLEVKGGINIEVEGGQWVLTEKDDNGNISNRPLKCSPFEQAEKSMRYFYNYFFEEFHQSFYGVYGYAVAFPQYVVSERLANEAPLDLIIDYSDMTSLQSKINRIFHYWRNKRNLRAPFSQDQKVRFITSINKRIALSAAAGALIPIKEREFAHLNIVQDSIIDALYNYQQAFIVGGAGTGKTWIGIKKVSRAALKGKKALFLCNSEALAEFIKDKLPVDPLINCYTLDQLMSKTLSVDFQSLPKDANGQTMFFDAITSQSSIEQFDSIVVDEAQDFTVDMALATRCFLRNEIESELYVLYDKNQNIFCRDFEDGFSISYPPFIMRYNIRNTGSIYEWAINCTGLGSDTIANSLLGVSPEYNEFSSQSQARKQLSGLVNRLIQKEYVPNRSIVVLSDVGFEQSILSGETQIGAYQIADKPIAAIMNNEVCFRTTGDFKGLEADIVIYLRHTNRTTPLDLTDRQNQYVAYTRARYYLHIFNILRD